MAPRSPAPEPLRTASEVAAAVDAAGDDEAARFAQRFFKTGPGEYGEGDVFAGVRMPVVRALARRAGALPLDEATRLLESSVHEHRLAALVVMVERYKTASRPRTRDDATRDELHHRYLDAVHAGRVNNWDLVDVSAEWLVGDWLLGPPPHARDVLDELAASSSLWERRVAMLSTFAFTKAGDPGPAFTYAQRLLGDREDLMHKAVGWMLREVGKRVGPDTLRAFLADHAARMPRTALSYSTEHLSADERARFRALR
jgi:3-methyladenine DNA glycosylase AlkD